MSRRRTGSDGGLPPLFVWLSNAAKLSGRDAKGAEIGGAPDALRELGTLASRTLPIHGVFVPNNPDICVEIQRISKAHLRFDQARESSRKLLDNPRRTLPFTGRPATDGEITYAEFAGRTPHVVVSRTLQTVSWKNTRIVRDIEDVRRLKEAAGGDMHAVGGATLVSSLMNSGPR
jgi:hypothetical protein